MIDDRTLTDEGSFGDRVTDLLAEPLAWGLALLALSISYAMQIGVAQHRGFQDWTGYAWPATSDAGAFCCLLLTRKLIRAGRSTWESWLMTGAATTVMVVTNVAANPSDTWGAVMHSWPPVFAFGVWHVLTHTLRPARRPNDSAQAAAGSNRPAADGKAVATLEEEQAAVMSLLAEAAREMGLPVPRTLAALEPAAFAGSSDSLADDGPVAGNVTPVASAVRPDAVMPLAAATSSAGREGGQDDGREMTAKRTDDGHADGHEVGHDAAVDRPSTLAGDGPADGQEVTAAMTAGEAKVAVARLVKRARARGRTLTAADVQRVTGRSARQARRLLTAATADAEELRPQAQEVER